MTAKEMKDSKYFRHEQDGEVLSEGYLFTEEEMAIFWSQLCKEQRVLCLRNEEQSILDAPEPRFE